MTFVLGLTGSIGMGKSTTAGLFRRARRAGARRRRRRARALSRPRRCRRSRRPFPARSSTASSIARELGAPCSASPRRCAGSRRSSIRWCGEEEQAFLARCRAGRRGLAVLDVPLLFETGGEERCDAVLVVTAPAEVQRAARPGAPGHDRRRSSTRSWPGRCPMRRSGAAPISLWTRRAGCWPRSRQVGSILSALAGRPGPRRVRTRGPERDA